jgi:hypothetical protein
MTLGMVMEISVPAMIRAMVGEVVRTAVQSPPAMSAMHQHPRIAFSALGAIDMQRLATPLASLEVERIQTLALAAQRALAHRPGGLPFAGHRNDLRGRA